MICLTVDARRSEQRIATSRTMSKYPIVFREETARDSRVESRYKTGGISSVDGASEESTSDPFYGRSGSYGGKVVRR